MQTQEIAVVVTDVEAEHEELTAMVKLLKQENPQILTIVITRTSDAEMIIELINQAQIFRFLNKPVNVRLLKKHMHAALQRYLTFMEAPELTREHRVQNTGPARSTRSARKMADHMKSIREKWFGAGDHRKLGP